MNKTVVIGLLSLVYVGTIVYLVDLSSVASVLGQISVAALSAAASLIVLAHLLVLLRAGAVLRSLGFWPGWRALFLAFSASNITNLPLNVVGQSLTRAAVLVRSGVPFGATVMATYIERFLAAGLLFLFALAALWFLFGTIGLDLHQGAGAVLSTSAGLAIVGAAVAFFMLRGALLERLRAGLRWVPKLWTSAGLTILVHGAGLGAYLVLLAELAPQGVSAGVIAALVIVILVTVLPISFAGWGLRELSAASALSLVGIAPEIAVAVALVIGLLYLAATGLFAALGLPLLAGAPPAVAPAPSQHASHGQDWDSKIIQGCTALTAILLFFRLPTAFGESALPVNVNIADIVVFVGLGVVLLMIAARRLCVLFPPWLSFTVIGLSSLIVLGLTVSYAADNLGGWALYTRGVGWILMLGYAALGAAIVVVAGEAGRLLIVRAVIFAAMTVCVLQLLALAWTAFVSPLPAYVLAVPLQGFAGNQNAFAFELALVGVLLITARALGIFDSRRWTFAACVALLALTMFFTGSRTSTVFLLLLAALDYFWSRRSGTAWHRAMLLAATATVAVILLPYAVYPAAQALRFAFGVEINADAVFSTLAQPDRRLYSIPVAPDSTRLMHPSADVERRETVVGGLALWRESPFVGAGLGAYVESVLARGEHLHGIHSIYVWFLAEMGIVGLGLVVGLGVLIAVTAWRKMALAGEARAGSDPGLPGPEYAPWAFSLFGILSIMAIGGLVQDFFFQRMFWFLLGLAAVVPGALKRNADARIFLGIVAGISAIIFALAL